MQPEFLRVPEVATILGMSEKGVRWRIARGELPFRRWGRSLLISRHDLTAFLAELPGCTALDAAEACQTDQSERVLT
jgi:excisionase family DNA binding protein